MVRLRDTRVKRGGTTSRYWYRDPETDDVELLSNQGFELSFSISSKGGGETTLSITIGSKDFSVLLECMSSTDRQTALAAMAKELRRQVLLQPSRDKEKLAEGREQLRSLARKEWERLPSGKDDEAGKLMDGVEHLIQELNVGKKKKR